MAVAMLAPMLREQHLARPVWRGGVGGGQRSETEQSRRNGRPIWSGAPVSTRPLMGSKSWLKQPRPALQSTAWWRSWLTGALQPENLNFLQQMDF